MRRLLVTSVGSGVGQEIVTAVRNADQPYYVAGTNSIAAAAGVFDCDSAWLSPPVAQADGYTARLREVVAAERPRLILPARDDDLPIVARHRDEFLSTGAFAMVSSPDAIEICNDKYRSAQYLRAADLPFSETIAVPDEIDGFLTRSSFPYIAKPRRGYASKGVKVLFSPEDVRRALSEDGDTVVQEYLVRAGWEQNRQRYDRENIYEDGALVRGEELTIMAFLGDDGDVMGLCPLLKDGLNGIYWEVLDKPQIEEKARRIFEVLGSAGVRGPCNIQGIETASDEAWFFEINARLTGACAHCEVMGFDLFEATWQHFIEGKDVRKFLHVDRGLAFVRTWGTTVVRKDSVARLRDEKYWRRDRD